MSEQQDNPPEQKKDAWDALEDLAAGKDSGSRPAPSESSGLAMLAGQADDPRANEEEDPLARLANSEEAVESDEEAAAEDTVDAEAPPFEAVPVAGGAAPVSRKERDAAYQTRARAATAHHFRKTMIPLLLIVAGLLFILATITLVVVDAPPDEEAVFQKTDWLVKYGRALALVAYPLGVILIGGAWWFRRDIKRAGGG